MTLLDLIKIVQEWIWCEVVDPRLKPIYKNGEFTGEVKQPLSFKFLYYVLQYPLDLIYAILWRIFIRGKCALKGCQIVYFDNWNLPDDCYEWMCERCGSEGINHQINTAIEPFYNDTPFKNFIQALKGK